MRPSLLDLGIALAAGAAAVGAARRPVKGPAGRVRFEDVSVSSGIRTAAGPGLGVVASDFDADGWLDLYVANDGYPNHLWLNQGDGTFLDDALLLGAAFNVQGMAEAGMGVVAADFDDDLDLDLFMTHLRNEIAALEYGELVNLIVLSDHGMGPTSPDKYVDLNAHIKEQWTGSIIGGNPVFLIEAAEGCADSITSALDPLDGVLAWQKTDIPQRLHYGNSTRFPGIVVQVK